MAPYPLVVQLADCCVRPRGRAKERALAMRAVVPYRAIVPGAMPAAMTEAEAVMKVVEVGEFAERER